MNTADINTRIAGLVAERSLLRDSRERALSEDGYDTGDYATPLSRVALVALRATADELQRVQGYPHSRDVCWTCASCTQVALCCYAYDNYNVDGDCIRVK